MEFSCINDHDLLSNLVRGSLCSSSLRSIDLQRSHRSDQKSLVFVIAPRVAILSSLVVVHICQFPLSCII
jgi:hypothetical protein